MPLSLFIVSMRAGGDGQHLFGYVSALYVPMLRTPQEGFGVQHESAQQGVGAPGRGQLPAEPRIDDDVQAIGELLNHIRSLWADLTTHSREVLEKQLEMLASAADSRDTGSKPVRATLQQVLLTIGTGALAVLSEPTRRRLAALTGIALPGSGTPAG
jgi:hypothetical protein